MNKINREIIEKLMEGTGKSPAVTIYLPTHRASTPPHMHEDQVRFKNLSSKAAKLIEERDAQSDFGAFFKEKTEALLDDQDFWENLTESVLICANPGMFEYYHLPIDSDEYVSVDTHLHLAPLLGLLNENQNFHILAVNQKEPFLLSCDMYGYEVADIALPQSIEEALNIDEMHLKSLQHASVRGPKGAEYHGHGAGKDTGQAEHHLFQKLIDEKATHYINSADPTILVGTESEVGDYRTLTQLKRVINEPILGSYDLEHANQLYKDASDIIRRRVVDPHREEVLADFTRLEGQSPNMVAASYAGIQDAAEKGRVDTLALGLLRYTTDTVRDNMNRVVKLSFPNTHSRQALDDLALRVWRQGGKIVNLYRDQMPRDLSVLAINRY